jgi:hypothetical protein
MQRILIKLAVITALASAPFAGMMAASRPALACWGCNHHTCVTVLGDGGLTCSMFETFPFCSVSGSCIG